MQRRIQEFRLLDDDFMTKCFEENTEAVELVLRIVLDRADLKVERAQTQYYMKNIKGRSLRLDIYAADSDGVRYNIEIQRTDKGAGAKRARYNSSLLDSDALPAGTSVDDLTESYVIFITENDVIGGNQPIYHIDRYIKEIKQPFCDGAHIIYVNASYHDDSSLGRLMQDFCRTEPEEMHYKILADAVGCYKKESEGIKAMSRVMEELIEDEKKEIAVNMLEDGKLTKEEIVYYLNLPLSVVEELEKELQ